MKKVTWKEARELKGMKQEEIAHELCMSRELYNMKENYKRKMTISEALQFEKIVGISLNNIIVEKRE